MQLHVDNEYDIQPCASGIRHLDDGEGTYVKWAVFKLCDLSFLDESREEDLVTEYLAEKLTGWGEYASSPGRRFADAPNAKVSRTRVLVTQYTALDI